MIQILQHINADDYKKDVVEGNDPSDFREYTGNLVLEVSGSETLKDRKENTYALCKIFESGKWC